METKTQQLNVRMTPSERADIDALARRLDQKPTSMAREIVVSTARRMLADGGAK